jgi:hypothetical protein
VKRTFSTRDAGALLAGWQGKTTMNGVQIEAVSGNATGHIQEPPMTDSGNAR